MIDRAAAYRILRKERTGNSIPLFVDTSVGTLFVKLRGSGSGPEALVSEVIGTLLAGAIDLPTAAMYVVGIDDTTPTNDNNDELRDVIERSFGDNLGFTVLEHAYPIRQEEVDAFSPDDAVRILWLDWLLENVDRTAANPNILVRGRKFWLIDFGASMRWQYLRHVSEYMPGRRMDLTNHVFAASIDMLDAWHPILTERITRERLYHIVEQVPETFVSRHPFVDFRQWEHAMAAYLWKRLNSRPDWSGL